MSFALFSFQCLGITVSIGFTYWSVVIVTAIFLQNAYMKILLFKTLLMFFLSAGQCTSLCSVCCRDALIIGIVAAGTGYRLRTTPTHSGICGNSITLQLLWLIQLHIHVMLDKLIKFVSFYDYDLFVVFKIWRGDYSRCSPVTRWHSL